MAVGGCILFLFVVGRDVADGRGLDGAIAKIGELREQYWRDVNVPGSTDDLNHSLEKAGRVADFFKLAELRCTKGRFDFERRRTDRIRARLPGGDLRIVRVHDQRNRARAVIRDHGVTAQHAAFQGRPGVGSGAMARQSVSGDQGSGGGSRRIRPHHRGRRLREPFYRKRAGWEHDPGAQGECRSRDGCGGLHWVRSGRGGVSEGNQAGSDHADESGFHRGELGKKVNLSMPTKP
jgi:hypothetical protein